jgi:nitroreductase
VPRDLIERVLQSACYAPSGHNRQPVVWTVVSGADSVRALSAAVITWMQKLVDQAHPLAEMLLAERLVDRWHRGEDPILRHAPQVVIAHTAAADPTGSGASLIAMTYFQLAAEALELATCWAGYFQMAAGADPAVAALVKLPADHRIHAASMLGYAKYSYPAIPPRNAPNIYWQ